MSFLILSLTVVIIMQICKYKLKNTRSTAILVLWGFKTNINHCKSQISSSSKYIIFIRLSHTSSDNRSFWQVFFPNLIVSGCALSVHFRIWAEHIQYPVKSVLSKRKILSKFKSWNGHRLASCPLKKRYLYVFCAVFMRVLS